MMDLNASEPDAANEAELTAIVEAEPDDERQTLEVEAEVVPEDDTADASEGEAVAEIDPADDLGEDDLPEPAEVDEGHLRLLEALIFASAEAVPQSACKLRLPEGAAIPALLARLRADYATRGVNLMKVGKGWAFRTATDLAPQLATNREITRKMSRAAVETLAVIAYHQPVTRAEIEEIRGVSLSKGSMDVLFESGWIRPRGRRRTPGRPVTWGTSEAFLDHFTLESLDDLPGVEDLRAAGLLDKRPAIQTLGIQGGEPQDPDTLAEPMEEVDLTEDPLDPEDGDPRALMSE